MKAKGIAFSGTAITKYSSPPPSSGCRNCRRFMLEYLKYLIIEEFRDEQIGDVDELVDLLKKGWATQLPFSVSSYDKNSNRSMHLPILSYLSNNSSCWLSKMSLATT